MSKTELKDMLKDHLSIRITEESGLYTKRIRVAIHFNGEEIDADTFDVDDGH